MKKSVITLKRILSVIILTLFCTLK